MPDVFALLTTDPAAAEEVTRGAAFIGKLVQGGWTMFFLLLVSVAGLAFAVERFVNLRRSKIAPRRLADEADDLWRRGKTRELAALVENDRSTLGRAVAALIEYHNRGPDFAGRMAADVASRDLRRHLQRAYPLAVVATISPLLGLLGTVIGMIGAFDSVAVAGQLGDASILGGDISKALITTGVGLAIAIPALALYHYFKARTALFALEVEEAAGGLVAGWEGGEDGRQETGDGQRRTRARSEPTVAPAPEPRTAVA